MNNVFTMARITSAVYNWEERITVAKALAMKRKPRMDEVM
jgi:hypothetical protein